MYPDLVLFARYRQRRVAPLEQTLFFVTHYRGRLTFTFRACLETGFRVVNLFPDRFAWEIVIWDDE